MGENYHSPADPAQLRIYDVISVSPVNDPLRLTGTTVIADCVFDAQWYLREAGGWRDDKEQDLLYRRYQFIERPSDRPVFNGTKAQWIQAVRLGYSAKPVRFAPNALTQARIDKLNAAENERIDRLIFELSKPNFFETVVAWYRRQFDHPRRWMAIGAIALSVYVYVNWDELVLHLIGLFVVFLLYRWIRE